MTQKKSAKSAVVREDELKARRGDKQAKEALARYEEANDAFDGEDYAEAAEQYAAALKAVPGFIEAAYNGATALLLLDRFADAMEGFRKTLELDPEHAMACSNGAVAATRLDDFAGAVELGRRAMALDPDLADIALPNLGNALVRTGDLAGARKVAKQLDELDPEAAEALRQRIAHPPKPGEKVEYSRTLDGKDLDEEDPLQKAYQLLAEIEADEDDACAKPGDVDGDLVLAAYFGDAAKAKRALKSGASPDAQQKGTGYPALVLAVSNGHTAMVRLLLESGAKPNSKAKVGKVTVSALERAEGEGKTDIVKLLRKHGATG